MSFTCLYVVCMLFTCCLHVVIAIRNDPEYHVAMEMEVWRAEQEELFMKQVIPVAVVTVKVMSSC